MRAIYFVILLAFSTLSLADILPSKEAAKALAKSVMDKVEKGKSAEGIDLVKSYLIIPEAEFNVMKNQLALQAPMIEKRFGKTVGVELVGIEEIGNSLLKVLYIQKFEKHLMRWKFYFYKPNDGWVLNTFNTDDKIQYMFKDM